MTDIHRLLGSDLDVTLLKGGGTQGPRERVFRHVKRTGLLSRLFPNRFQYQRFRIEFATFAAALLPHLVRAGYDVVHFIDPPLGKPLHRIRKLAGRRFSLLFTNGGPVSYDCSRWADHIHCVTPTAVLEACQKGLDRSRLTMLPVGVDTSRFRTSGSRDEIRRKLNIAPDAFMILAVTSLNRAHKRVDHLIDEVAQVSGDLVLWVEGSLHPDGDASLLTLGSERLGGRWRHSQIRSEQIGDLFGCADILVSSAIQESFGLAIVEAACAGLPVVVHDSPHFRWLLGGNGYYVDMSSRGALAEFLGWAMSNRGELRRAVDPQALLARFGWTRLKTEYANMYTHIAALAAQGGGPT